MKQKKFFNEIEYDKLYPFGSAPARIYGTPKMHKFSSSDSFPKLCPIFSSIGTFNYNLACFLCDLQDPTLKCEASLQRFLCKLKQKNFFNEIEYDKLYPSGSAPARIYGTPKMHKFSSSDSFPKLRLIVSSISTFNYNLARFLCDLFSPLVFNDYSSKDTFSFVSQVKNANLSKKSCFLRCN